MKCGVRRESGIRALRRGFARWAGGRPTLAVPPAADAQRRKREISPCMSWASSCRCFAELAEACAEVLFSSDMCTMRSTLVAISLLAALCSLSAALIALTSSDMESARVVISRVESPALAASETPESTAATGARAHGQSVWMPVATQRTCRMGKISGKCACPPVGEPEEVHDAKQPPQTSGAQGKRQFIQRINPVSVIRRPANSVPRQH